MRVVITGVAGFIGSRLAQHILDNHPRVEVIGIDDFSSSYPESVPEGIYCHDISLGKGDKRLERIFAHRDIDVVFHLAAYAAECMAPFRRCHTYTNNILGTAEVVNACINHKVGRLVFTSSIAVYGNGTGWGGFWESHVPQPIDAYGISKYASEMDIQVAGDHHGLDYCIVRPFNVTGRGQSIYQRYRNVFGVWMQAVLEGRPMQIYGDGTQTRAFTPIDDILEPLWLSGTRKHTSHQVINLGSESHYSVADAARLLQSIIGPEAKIEHREGRHEVRHASCQVDRAKYLLDYRENDTLKNCLREMWDWARSEWDKYPERHTDFTPAPVEVEEGLYPYWKELKADVQAG